MKPDYWLERWQLGRIGFHREAANPRLVEQRAFFNDCLRVLVPLCGKSHDLEWLAIHGLEVVGIELSDVAARAFFEERGLQPERREQGRFIAYQHGQVTILVGDFFDASADELGYFDAAYDRAATIALPEDLRPRYAAKLRTLLGPKAKLLLVTLDYDAAGGPPFAVSEREVREAYGGCLITTLASVDARDESPGPVERGASFVRENVYGVVLPE
jgi:thiopurine S-methyltransferase